MDVLLSKLTGGDVGRVLSEAAEVRLGLVAYYSDCKTTGPKIIILTLERNN